MASSPSDLSDFARRVCVMVGITLFFTLLVWLIGASFDVLLLLLGGILIASPLRAAAHWLSRRTGWREGIALLVVGLTLVGVLVGLGMLVIPLISEQAQQLQEELPNVWQNARRQLEERSWGRQLVHAVADRRVRCSRAVEVAVNLAVQCLGTVDMLTNLYIVFFWLCFWLLSPRLYIDGIVGLVPQAGRQRTRHIMAQIDDSLLGWLLGTLISMTLVGAFSWLGLSLLGVQLAGILALFAALITFIPNLGPVLALIPALLFALLDGPQQGLNVILLYGGIQFVESNLITPLVQKRLNDIPPALLLGYPNHHWRFFWHIGPNYGRSVSGYCNGPGADHLPGNYAKRSGPII